RYARALTGSQRSGDAYVRASLEALLSGDTGLQEGLPPRVALYRLFHAIWVSSAPPNEAAGDDTGATRPADRLMRLGPASRQALLLTAMEGFSNKETARVLDIDEDSVEQLVADAQSEIEAELATDVLIIEDEPV